MTITLATLDMKLDSMAADLAEIRKELQAMNGRQRDDHDEVIVLKERLSTQARNQSTLTVILSAIATAVGSAVGWFTR